MAKSGLTKGVSWPLGIKPIVIGRDPSCDISILDGHVSRRHCQIESAGDTILLTDLGSRNTTLVNGKPATRATLRPGDEISVGNVLLLVTETSGQPAPETPTKQPGSTLSIRQSSGFYVKGRRADFLASGKTHTVQDLADLYSLSRALWTVEGMDDLVERMAGWLRDRFAPRAAWLAFCPEGEEDPEVRAMFSASDSVKLAAPRDAIGRSIKSQDGLLVALGKIDPGATAFQTQLVAPLVVGTHPVGAVAVQSYAKGKSYDESDLELLLAAVCIAAPWFHSIAEIEALKLETERLRQIRPDSQVLLGSSQQMEQTRAAIRKAARSDLNVLILGETGSGKELAARMVHDLSARSAAPFIALNCAAIPRELFESEVFGYEPGAFTGATHRKPGLLEECEGGTLFLDEVGDLSTENQARLLRVIESHVFRRLGGNKEHRADFRVVSATNRPLAKETSKGVFRKDLYYRLNSIEIAVPPLRSHTSDIPELAEHFLNLARLMIKRPLKGIQPEALEVLKKRSWPGNVRELRAVIERAAATMKGDTIGPEDFDEASVYTNEGEFLTLTEVEKAHVLRALEHSGGSITAAARLLGIGRTTLYDKLSRYRIASHSDDDA